MIVGTKDINPQELLKNCRSVETLREYCTLLVPRVIRHNKSIVDNQKYICALYVREFKSLSYKDRKELYEGLLKDVSITGLANYVYDFNDILNEIDIEKLAMYVAEGR